MTRSLFTPNYRRFRRLLVQCRQESEVTQVELAELLDRNQSYVSKFERGERRLDVVECLEVLRALEVDPIEFFTRLLKSSG